MVISELLYPFAGWIYLWVCYRDGTKVKAVLEKQFDGSYYDCGAIKILQVVGFGLIALLIVFLISAFYGTLIRPLI